MKSVKRWILYVDENRVRKTSVFLRRQTELQTKNQRQLSAEGFNNTEEEAQVRFLLHHSYNDCFYREPTELTPDDNDKLLFKQNALWLIENSIADDVMRAEFYREIGEMDISRKIIEETFPTDDLLKYIKNEIVSRIEQNDNAVFKLSDDEQFINSKPYV